MLQINLFLEILLDLFLYNNYIIEDKKSINYSSINNFINKVNNIKSLCLKNSNKVYYSIIPEKMYFASNKEFFDTIEDTLKSSFDFKYIKIVGGHILKNTDNNVILTEVDNELLFQDASVREEYEALKQFKEQYDKKNNN